MSRSAVLAVLAGLAVTVALVGAVALSGAVAPPTRTDTAASGVPSAGTGSPAQGDLPPVAAAPPGTVFRTWFSTRGGGGTPVGLVKRGASGDLLFNPSLDLVSLSAGDSLVARSGRQYRVTRSQAIPGGSGFVGPGATVYRGERNLRFAGFDGRELVGPAGGDSEGATAEGATAEGATAEGATAENATEEATLDLDGTIPADQPTGAYLDPATGEPALTVREPRVTDLRVLDRFGREVRPGDRLTPDNVAIVAADVNFLDASRARLALVDPATGRVETAGVLTRRQTQVLFPTQGDTIARIVPPGHARPEGPDGTARSLANPAIAPNGTVYLIQYLRPIRRAGTYAFVVGADDRRPFGDLYDAGAWRTVQVEHTLAGTTFLGFGGPIEDDVESAANETVQANATDEIDSTTVGV